MPRKLSFIDFKNIISKHAIDYNTLDLSYIDQENFDYGAQNKLYCNNHKIFFERKPKIFCNPCKGNRLKYYVCPICSKEHSEEKRIKTITGHPKPGSGKQKIFTQEDVLNEIDRKNSNIILLTYKDKYTYNDIVKLKCKIHGVFEKSIRLLFRSNFICNKCANKHINSINIKNGILRRRTFIEDAIKIHGDEYNYSKVDNEGKLKKVEIICNIHGPFWQMPSLHLRGEGCPLCQKEGISNNERRLGYLINKRFPNLILEQQWNKVLKRQKLDYYIEKYKLGIEYQGPQHFIDVNWFNDYRHNFDHRKELDKQKHDICKENGIKVLYFTFNKEFNNIKYIDNVYTELGKLYDAIKERAKEFGDILS